MTNTEIKLKTSSYLGKQIFMGRHFFPIRLNTKVRSVLALWCWAGPCDGRLEYDKRVRASQLWKSLLLFHDGDIPSRRECICVFLNTVKLSAFLRGRWVRELLHFITAFLKSHYFGLSSALPKTQAVWSESCAELACQMSCVCSVLTAVRSWQCWCKSVQRAVQHSRVRHCLEPAHLQRAARGWATAGQAGLAWSLQGTGRASSGSCLQSLQDVCTGKLTWKRAAGYICIRKFSDQATKQKLNCG